MNNDNHSTFASYPLHYRRMGNRRPSVQLDPLLARIDGRKPWMEGLPSDAAILDVGCGWGHQLMTLKFLGFIHLTGIEIVPESLAIAREELGKDATLLLADALEYLPRQENRFDVIILNDVLEHIPPRKSVELLRLIHRALRPGGWVSLRVPNMSSLLAAYSMHLDFTHVTGFTEYSLMQILDLAGFSDYRLVSSRPRLFFSWARPGAVLRRLLTTSLYWGNIALHLGLYLLRRQLPLPREFGMNVEICGRKPPAAEQ